LTWEAFVERWHEFYLMTGTAAVTLAGLLFVAISLHVDALVHPSREHLLSLARATLLSFVFVLTLSLMMLVPAPGMRVMGVTWLLLGTVFSGITLRQILRSPIHHDDFSRGLFRRRLMFPLIGYAWTAVSGAVLLRREPEALFLIVGALCMLLGNAAGTSWDLLVRVARIRRRAAEDESPSSPRDRLAP
jgi:hypothetical protein